MDVIHKFPLKQTLDLQVVYMTLPAKILSAGMQGEEVVVWAQVDPNADVQNRLVQIVFTGSPAPLDARFLATLFSGGLVLHVFEVNP